MAVRPAGVFLLILGLLVGLTAARPPHVATAAAPEVVTAVDVRETTADAAAQLHVDVTLVFPGGYQPGQSNSLRIPRELHVLNGTRFPIRSSGGTSLAVASVQDNLMTITATDAIAGLSNVSGSAWFLATREYDVPTGSPIPLVFTTATATFTDSITFTGDVSPTAADKTYKWGSRTTVDELQWGILAARPASAGRTIVFDDTVPPGAGWEFACGPTSVSLFGWERGLGQGFHWIGDLNTQVNGFTVDECTPHHVKATFVVPDMAATDGTMWQPELRLEGARITNPDVARWENSAQVLLTDTGETIPLVDTISNENFSGGILDGDAVTITKYVGDPIRGDHDAAPGLTVRSDVPTPLSITVRNSGSRLLRDVVVRDTTRDGPAVTDLVCVFPDGGRVAAVGGVVTSQQALASGVTFTCSGHVPALAAGQSHEDVASVSATGGGPVGAADSLVVRASASLPPSPGPEPRPDPTPRPIPTPTGPKPQSRTVTYTYQVDRYSRRTPTLRRHVDAYLADRRLHLREDRPHWGASAYEFVTVNVPEGASATTLMAAVNRATSRRTGDVTSTSRRPARGRGDVVVAWRLAPGATVARPWGALGRTAQLLLGQGPA